jgi:hypothetical protein
MLGKGWKCTLSKNKTNMGKQNMARAESATVNNISHPSTAQLEEERKEK